MVKSIVPSIRKSLDFLDNTKIRLLIVVLLVIYSSFISIQYNYSTLFNKPIIRLFFLLIIVVVAMKDITIALLLTIAMLISINYKPTGAINEAMTLNCTPVGGSGDMADSEGAEGFDGEAEPDAESAEGFSMPGATPLPSNVPAKTTPSASTQAPAPTNTTVQSSQPANVATRGTNANQLPTQVATSPAMPTPPAAIAPTMTTNGDVVSSQKSAKAIAANTASMAAAAAPTPASGGNSTTASLTKKITEMFKPKKMHKKPRTHNKTKEHFSINGFLGDDEEGPAEYNSSTNCMQVLRGTSGNNLNLSSQCGAVATFQDELNAQGMIELPMGYHSMGNWGSL